MAQSLAKLHIHLVFSTKRREPLLFNTLRDPLHRYMYAILKEYGCMPVILNSVHDHVHILFELGRTISVSNIAEEVKKSSSKWIKTQGDNLLHFRWQAGYGAFAVSAWDVNEVRNYIEYQQEHHKDLTFADEYRQLLDKHGIKYDEKYIWE